MQPIGASCGMVVSTLSHSSFSRLNTISSVFGPSLHCRPQFQVTVGLGIIPCSSESALMVFMTQW